MVSYVITNLGNVIFKRVFSENFFFCDIRNNIISLFSCVTDCPELEFVGLMAVTTGSTGNSNSYTQYDPGTKRWQVYPAI